jgi:hypothetical protein
MVGGLLQADWLKVSSCPDIDKESKYITFFANKFGSYL